MDLVEEFEEKMRVTDEPSTPTLVVPQVLMQLPSRPGFGKSGKPVKLHVNHFTVRRTTQNDAYHYDVAIRDNEGRGFGGNNDTPPKSLAQAVMKVLVTAMNTQFPSCVVASDGIKNLYTPALLPFQELLFKDLRLPDDGGKPRVFQALVKEANPVAVRMHQLEEFCDGRLNYMPQDALQALDVAMRHSASARFTIVGRNQFSGHGARDIGEGADLWFGYFQSMRATQSRLVVNLDLAATAFVKAMAVLDFLPETLGARDMPTFLNRYQHADFSKAIRGVKVTVNHRPGVKRAYRVNGLSPNSAEQTFFEDDKGRRVSIVQYFAENYKLRLRYPKLPCLHVGAVQKKNYLPMEVCSIMEGQKCPRKATDRQVANMIRFTCVKPEDRKRAIEAKLAQAKFSTDPMLRQFGLEVNPKMITTQGRQLVAPQMLYGKKGTENASDGVWNMRNKNFYQSAQLKSWAVISNCDSRRCPESEISNFFSAVIRQMGQLGMVAPKSLPPIVMKRDRNDNVRSMFIKALDAGTKAFKVRPQIIWMINPMMDGNAYGELKRTSDTEYGIVSQCMLAKHLQKCSPQYIANILLKVNTKLGGKNTIINGPLPKISASRTIIFGADVTHPSPMDKTRPSIAAVVASMDAGFIKHVAAIRAQGHRVEQIMNLQEMVRDLLIRFREEANGPPERIVFYRDGVSEGQFQMVLNYEVTAIRAACASLSPNYNPPITFMVVQKRHNTRFFPESSKDADRSGNVKAGTVVDTGVCHPVENDFFLMSHAGLQGTSRPTHYHVLLDEIGFTADELQTLTYKLCYTFARCTRSVSMVPAAYYSHLVAFRARFFSLDGSDAGSNYGGSNQSANTRMLEVHNDLKHVMYYV